MRSLESRVERRAAATRARAQEAAADRALNGDRYILDGGPSLPQIILRLAATPVLRQQVRW